mmetsp:Transcript_11102/g.39226  ORF Transcript_11102/g.39226 Transcript_11102/m.39226 type:complete len:311 (-) Transcript_11102:240-1172(-)
MPPSEPCCTCKSSSGISIKAVSDFKRSLDRSRSSTHVSEARQPSLGTAPPPLISAFRYPQAAQWNDMITHSLKNGICATHICSSPAARQCGHSTEKVMTSRSMGSVLDKRASTPSILFEVGFFNNEESSGRPSVPAWPPGRRPQAMSSSSVRTYALVVSFGSSLSETPSIKGSMNELPAGSSTRTSKGNASPSASSSNFEMIFATAKPPSTSKANLSTCIAANSLEHRLKTPSIVDAMPRCVFGGISSSKHGTKTRAVSDLMIWRFKSRMLVHWTEQTTPFSWISPPNWTSVLRSGQSSQANELSKSSRK